MTSAIFWSVKVLSHGCMTADPYCCPLTFTGPCKPLSTIMPIRPEPPFVNSDQPNRKRLGTDAWFAFFALNSCVHLLNVGLFAIIHSLTDARWRFWLFVHCVVISKELVVAVAIRRQRAVVLRALPAHHRPISLRSADAID